ncbi:MAG: LexA binding domain, partial [Candidatus Parcubacteria bacterium]
MIGTQEKLTKKQTEILRFIRGFISENDYAPSYREIG